MNIYSTTTLAAISQIKIFPETSGKQSLFHFGENGLEALPRENSNQVEIYLRAVSHSPNKQECKA